MNRELTSGEAAQLMRQEFNEMKQMIMLFEKTIMDFEARITEIESQLSPEDSDGWVRATGDD